MSFDIKIKTICRWSKKEKELDNYGRQQKKREARKWRNYAGKSVKMVNDKKIETTFIAEGPGDAMVHALMEILDKEFGMICLPKDRVVGIGVCMADPDSDDYGSDEPAN